MATARLTISAVVSGGVWNTPSPNCGIDAPSLRATTGWVGSGMARSFAKWLGAEYRRARSTDASGLAARSLIASAAEEGALFGHFQGRAARAGRHDLHRRQRDRDLLLVEPHRVRIDDALVGDD